MCRTLPPAAAALVGITAHLGLFRCAHLQAGETVFVNGGTGGVGSMAVQMARAAGARVITTVGSAEKASRARLGGRPRLELSDRRRAGQDSRGSPRDRGCRCGLKTQRRSPTWCSVELLSKRGRMVILAGRQAQPIFPVGPFYVKDLSLFGFAMFNASADEQRICAHDMNRWLAENKLQAPIGRTFALAEAAAAHRLLEDNTLHQAGTLTGKIALTITGE